MKKFFTPLFFALALAGIAQSQSSFIAFRHLTTTSVVPNSTIDVVTAAGSLTTVTIDFQNTSAVATNSYLVKRYDMALFVKMTAVDTTTASANFCVAGQCYGSSTILSPDPLILAPGQNSGSLAANYSLDCDLNEASGIGFSLVKYTLFDQNNVNDSIQFTMRYNQQLYGVGIKEQSSKVASLNIFPNPVKDLAQFSFNSDNSGSGHLSVINSIGENVFSQDVVIGIGKNTVPVNLSELPAGVYFVQLSNTRNMTETRKIIVQ